MDSGLIGTKIPLLCKMAAQAEKTSAEGWLTTAVENSKLWM